MATESNDWAEALTAGEREEWDSFVHHARTELVHKLDSSAVVISLVPDEVDVKFAVELGLSIMMSKPVVALALPGVDVPKGLRRVADYVIELSQDLGTEAGREELKAALPEVLATLKKGGVM